MSDIEGCLITVPPGPYPEGEGPGDYAECEFCGDEFKFEGPCPAKVAEAAEEEE